MYFAALLLTLRVVQARSHLVPGGDRHLCDTLVAALTQHPEQERAPAFVRATLLSRRDEHRTIRITLGEDTQVNQAPASLQTLLSLPSLRIGQRDYIVESVELTDPVWTGIATWDDFALPRRSSLVRCTLATPLITIAPENGHPCGIGPFPEPTLLFSRMRRRWSVLGGPPLPQEVAHMIQASGCVLSNYHLHSITVGERGHRCGGYLGWFEYEHRLHNHAAVTALNALMRLAFFTGLGERTEQGLGETTVTLLY